MATNFTSQTLSPVILLFDLPTQFSSVFSEKKNQLYHVSQFLANFT